MTTFRQDPLLGIARGFLTLLIVLMLALLVGTLIGAPLLWVYRDALLGELVEQYGSRGGGIEIVWAFTALILTGTALAALGWRFLVLLRRIVDTVATGDPFLPDNAERLRRMGWLTLAAQVVVIPAAFIGEWVESILRDSDFDFGISLGALLLALVLFILARVFKRGAEMREELEGTV